MLLQLCQTKQGKEIPFTYKATASGWIYRRVAFYLPLTIVLPTVMIRTEVLAQVGDFDEKMERFEDTDMWRRVAKRYPVLAINEPLCKIRTHSDNELANQDPEAILQALDYYVNKVFNEDYDESMIFRRRGAARFYRHYGLAVLIYYPGWQSTARKFLLHSIRRWPFQIYAYLLLICTYLDKRTFAFIVVVWRVLKNLVKGKPPLGSDKTTGISHDRYG